jgi:hypothetical protein
VLPESPFGVAYLSHLWERMARENNCATDLLESSWSHTPATYDDHWCRNLAYQALKSLFFARFAARCHNSAIFKRQTETLCADRLRER